MSSAPQSVSYAWLDLSAGRRVAAVILLGLIVLLPGNDSLPLIDRDEPRFAQCTREMMDRGDYVVPYFNDQYRFDKPPLTYWLMAAGYTICGENEFGARLHSVVATILTALILLQLGTRMFDPRVGLAAAVGWLTCLQVLIHGRAAVADMPLVLAVTAGFWAAWELTRREPDAPYPWRWWALLYVSMGLGFLAKGPVAWAIPALAAVLFRWVLWRRAVPVSWWRILPGAVMVLAIVLPWAIPALIRTDGTFWDVGIGKHIVERGTGAFHGRGSFVFFYLLTAPLSLFPWSAFSGDVWRLLRRHWSRDQAFLLAWLVAPLVVFTPYSTQLPHYILPGLPAFFLIIAQVVRPDYVRSRATRRFATVCLGLTTALGLALVVVSAINPLPAPYNLLGPAVTAAGGLLLVLSQGLLAWNHGRPKLAILAAVGIGICLAAGGIALRRLIPSVQLEQLAAVMPPDTEYVFFGYEEPSLVFYGDAFWLTPVERTLPNHDFNDWLAAPGNHVVVVGAREQKLDKYLSYRAALLGHAFMRRFYAGPWILAPTMRVTDRHAEYRHWKFHDYDRREIQGLNLARSSWVEIEIYYKHQLPPAEAR